LELVAMVVTWLGAVAVFVYKLWREKQEQAQKASQTASVQNAQSGRDLISATGDVRTGGVDARAQRDFAVDGDLVSGPKTVIYQTASPSQSHAESSPPTSVASCGLHGA